MCADQAWANNFAMREYIRRWDGLSTSNFQLPTSNAKTLQSGTTLFFSLEVGS
jgi:hypothetical protein